MVTPKKKTKKKNQSIHTFLKTYIRRLRFHTFIYFFPSIYHWKLYKVLGYYGLIKDNCTQTMEWRCQANMSLFNHKKLQISSKNFIKSRAICTSKRGAISYGIGMLWLKEDLRYRMDIWYALQHTKNVNLRPDWRENNLYEIMEKRSLFPIEILSTSAIRI